MSIVFYSENKIPLFAKSVSRLGIIQNRAAILCFHKRNYNVGLFDPVVFLRMLLLFRFNYFLACLTLNDGKKDLLLLVTSLP